MTAIVARADQHADGLGPGRASRAIALVAFGALLVGVVAVARPSAAAPMQDGSRAEAPPWDEVLDRAVAAADAHSYRARAVVVTVEDGAPAVTELELTQEAGGTLRVGDADTWMVGRGPTTATAGSDDGFLWRADGEHLLQLGPVDPAGLDRDRLAEHWLMHCDAEPVELDTGPALALRVHERTEHGAPGLQREVLYVDEATGLVVRRETWDPDGRPVRVMAFTSLEVVTTDDDPAVDESPAAASVRDARMGRALTTEDLSTLRATGWTAPAALTGGFELLSGYVTPASVGGALHLVYSDGLYTLSLYEQAGRLDPVLTDTAVATTVEHDGRRSTVWRWPGSQPERVVWSAEGRTFTVITDAPFAALASPLGDLPRASDRDERSVAARLGRGAARVGSWLWPFG